MKCSSVVIFKHHVNDGKNNFTMYTFGSIIISEYINDESEVTHADTRRTQSDPPMGMNLGASCFGSTVLPA